ncbi:MAG: hypothetical protein ABR881_18850 [Candidatus Sulfotelmatobacter sp.]|jgi:hypothetical protein
MPRRKFIPGETYWQMPHADQPPPSLWWYKRLPAPLLEDDVPDPESQCVVDSYIRRASRGRTLPDGFEKKLARWLQDLSREQQISPRKKAYWTIPAYAKWKKLPEKTLCKRFRELENVAKELFPLRVPASRKPVVLTDEQQQEIRKRCLEGEDIQRIAEEFRIGRFRVGQIGRKEIAIRRAQREQAAAQVQEEDKTDYVDPALSDPF